MDVNRKIEALNRTREAVKKQIASMAAAMFEVGVFDPESERMILRTWDERTVVKSISWLRFENLKGRNIYIRPAGTHGLSLVDDLTAVSVHRMKAGGFAPAVVVETSPCNFQAWLQHGAILDKTLSTAVAKALAKKFDGDLGSADWRHFGRLAGFTNRKKKYRQAEGYFPYVRLVETTGKSYQAANSFVPEVKEALRIQIEAAKQQQRGRLHSRLLVGTARLKRIDQFRNDPRYGGANSRSDIAYAVYALDHGVSQDEIRAQILCQDLSYLGRISRQQDYVDRILQKARGFLECQNQHKI
jgi:hypothetical protein